MSENSASDVVEKRSWLVLVGIHVSPVPGAIGGGEAGGDGGGRGGGGEGGGGGGGGEQLNWRPSA